MSGGTAYREILRIRDARALIGASAASQLGDWLYNAALLGYVYAATGSTWWVGAATIVRLLPYMLLGPVGGALADRFRRRTVLLTGDLLRLTIMLGLAATVAADAPVVVVIGLTALASAAGTAERPAAIALLPRLVGETRMGAANALLHTVQDLGVVVGPAIGALLLAVGPDWCAFLANAATFAVSASLVATLSDRSRARRGNQAVGAHIASGLRAARTTRFVVPLIVVAGMVELTYGAQTVQLVVYAEHSLGLGSGGYGVLLTAAGAGGLLSTLANARLAMSHQVALVVVTTSIIACVTQLVYAGSSVVALAIAASVVGGGSIVACEVVAETALARIVPSDSLGRLIGIFEASSVAAMVSGALLAPVLIEATSLRASFLILGGAAIAATVLGRAALRGLDAASAKRSDQLASRVAVLEQLPITTGIPRIVLERLAAAAELCPLPAGVDVVVQGAPAHALFAVAEGAVVIHRNGVRVIGLGPGESFGERGLLDNAPRNATVTTEVDSTLLRIDAESLFDALQAAPALRPALDISNPPVQDPSVPPPAQPGRTLDDQLTVDGAVVAVVSGGYPGKRPIYDRLAALGAKLVILDEPGHWTEALVAEGIVQRWLATTVTGDADADADAVVRVLAEADVRPDGVLTFWEDSVPVVARVAAALGLPGNPADAVDSARSKLRTRELCARLGLPSPRAVRVRSLDELYAAAADLGFPAVVKPEFGASAVGCVRVDDFGMLPEVYRLVRGVVSAETDGIFRAGNDLMLEEYLDGVEFDVDLVLQDGECVFSSVSQNWPTAEPSFQETGLHCPPDHNRRAVRGLVEFCTEVARAFGFRVGVLHIEAKTTSRGPRIVEVNARMGGGRIHEIVEAVWGVDLVEAQLRASLGLRQDLSPSRRPRCAVVDQIVHAPVSGRLAALEFGRAEPDGHLGLKIDVEAAVGDEVAGPEAIFATVLAEVIVSGRDLRHARALAAEVLREPPRVEAAATALAG